MKKELRADSADDKFIFFSQKNRFCHFMQTASLGDNLHENLVYRELAKDPKFSISKTFKTFKMFDVLFRKITCSGIDFLGLSQLSHHPL